ncbi:hypothetical protein [Prevotella pallens]|jgi:putative lipoprotein|uniref:hypothetical protein n=1 Tax=Prevotella pallens TaxID=60133 RepID=UPI0028D87CA7|nr:hypothetical protein [Prevotella pallens]
MKFTKLFFIAIGCFLLTSCQESLEDKAAKECKEYTKKYCPTPMVNNTRMDSMTYEPQTRTIHYYYSIYNEGDNKANVEANKQLLQQILLNGIKTDTASKLYKEAGFNFRFTYRSGKNPKTILLDETYKKGQY